MEMYIYCIYSKYEYSTNTVYTLQIRMPSSGIVVHSLGRGCHFPNLQEIDCFKWEFCLRFARYFS
jgi:hypothetical protein